MSLVSPETLREYLNESEVTPELVAALNRAEAVAAVRLGCRELVDRQVTERITVEREYGESVSGLSSATGLGSLRFPIVYLSDGPAREVTSMTVTIGSSVMSVLSTSRVSDTGWAVHYQFPLNMGFTVDLPYGAAFLDIEYAAGWETEDDLPFGIMQFVLAQAAQVFATPIGGVIKVRLGDNYVDLSPDAIRKQVDEYAEMLDQWARVRL